MREISIYVCVAYIAICGPDEEQSGFVAFTMRVESGGKCECSLSLLQQTSNTESKDLTYLVDHVLATVMYFGLLDLLKYTCRRS